MSRGTHTYDHEIKIGTETYGLKLLTDANGAAMYQVTEDIPEYQPQLRFTQTDCRGGHGQYNSRIPDKYYEGQSIDTTEEGRVILGPLIYQIGAGNDGTTAFDSSPVCFYWFNAISKWMCATGRYLYWYDGTKFVEQHDFGAGEAITDMIEFEDILYVALDSASLYFYSSDGAAYTVTDLTDGYAEKFLVAPNPAGTANVLWKSKLPNELSRTTDGRTVAAGGAQWSSPAYIGDKSNNITGLFLITDNFMVGKEDNLFHYDTDGGLHPMLNDLRHNRSSTNFKYVTEWQSAMYVSLTTGLGEIIALDTFDPMGPLTEIDDIGKVGTCVGLTSEKDWIYAAMDEGTNTIIYKGREITQQYGLRWEWCPFVFVGTNACATAKVCQHTSTDRRLWFGYGNYAGYVILTDNPLGDSAAKFAASGFIRMSYFEGSNRYHDKLWQSIVTETEGCTTTTYTRTVTPQYRKDAETTATALTAAISTNGTVKTNLTTALSSKRIQFELHLASNDTSTTPEVLFFEARGVEKPETVRVHEAVYSLASDRSRSTKTLRTFLRGGRTSTSLIKFADLRYGQKTSGTSSGDYVWVIMQPSYPQEVEISHGKGKQPELGIRCRWQEVSFTIS